MNEANPSSPEWQGLVAPPPPKKPKWPIILIIVVGVLLVGGIGAVVVLYHVQNTPQPTPTTHQSSSTNKTNSSTNTPQTNGNVFTSPDKTFTVTHPFGWINNSSWQQPCGTISCVGRLAFTPLDAIAQYGAKYGNNNLYLAYATEVKTDLTPQQWFTQVINPPANDSTQTGTDPVNGYSAYYARVVDPNYTDDHYVISRNGVLVDISMREIVTTFQPQAPHTNTAPKIADQQNYSQYVSDYTQLVRSIKFNN